MWRRSKVGLLSYFQQPKQTSHGKCPEHLDREGNNVVQSKQGQVENPENPCLQKVHPFMLAGASDINRPQGLKDVFSKSAASGGRYVDNPAGIFTVIFGDVAKKRIDAVCEDEAKYRVGKTPGHIDDKLYPAFDSGQVVDPHNAGLNPVAEAE